MGFPAKFPLNQCHPFSTQRHLCHHTVACLGPWSLRFFLRGQSWSMDISECLGYSSFNNVLFELYHITTICNYDDDLWFYLIFEWLNDVKWSLNNYLLTRPHDYFVVSNQLNQFLFFFFPGFWGKSPNFPKNAMWHDVRWNMRGVLRPPRSPRIVVASLVRGWNLGMTWDLKYLEVFFPNGNHPRCRWDIGASWSFVGYSWEKLSQ